MDTAEVASGGQSRYETAAASSMVTVRLSDPPAAAVSNLPYHEHALGDPQGHEPAASQIRENTLSRSNTPDPNEDAIVLEGNKEDFPRGSIVSMANSMVNERSVSISGTFRSRSDSSGTLSSTGSAQVDWDELERSEEQAPRDEGSDEVKSTRI